MAFIPVHAHEEATARGSKRNLAEAREVRAVVEALLDGGDVTAAEIGVISPYLAHVALLRITLQVDGQNEENTRFADEF